LDKEGSFFDTHYSSIPVFQRSMRSPLEPTLKDIEQARDRLRGVISHIKLTLETRGHDHAKEVIRKLSEARYDVRQIH
jgi:hypothetical protein